jgi:tRNA modification GTPase
VFSTADTIVAVATPPGRGGLGVVRLSGPDAPRIAADLVGRRRPFRPRYATLARLTLADQSGVGDQVIITSFPAPASYTGEAVVEVSAHGSPVVLAAILRAAVDRGARLARPGEFTLRAFLNGKRDLVQAEAVKDLVDAVTPLQARAAFDQLEGTLTAEIARIETSIFELEARLEASLDFPDEGYHFIDPAAIAEALDRSLCAIDRLLKDASRGRLIRDGAQLAIVGAPNVGKSSLFNALVNANRAIVTEVPGTTRDALVERAEVGGLAVTIIDTAGLRATTDPVEREGVRRSEGAMTIADLLLVVVDRSRPLEGDDHRVLAQTGGQRRIVVANKVDLPSAWSAADPPGVSRASLLDVSALGRIGLDDLVERIGATLADDRDWRERPVVTNVRHGLLLTRTRETLARARGAVQASEGALPEEFLLADLQEARGCLEEVTGRRSSDDLLQHIFERFCIGK